MSYAKSVFIVGALLMSGCSSIEKADLSSDEPEEAIVEVENIMKNSRKNQFDLLANDQFTKGKRHFKKAKKYIGDDDKRTYILNTLAQSKAYFLEGQKVAKSRKAIPTRAFRARKSAYESGVFKDDILETRMNRVDNSLRSETQRFSSPLTVEELSRFERDYLRLEIDAVQNRELQTFRRIIKNAKEADAAKLVPKTYRNSLNDLKAAENMIQQSSRNPENYEASVTAIDRSSKLLKDVMKKLDGVAKGSSEEAVLELVYQERRLGTLSDRNTNLEGSLSRSRDSLAAKTGEAQKSQNKVRIQSAMDDMRRNFTNEEADVYQQGSDLIIRLKNMDFGVGSAMVPSKSMSLLTKINSVILKLNASKITVEGHTDDTGNTNLNQDLSVKRSQSVAEHLKSLEKAQYEIQTRGYGETRPIANNQTRNGRATNRRVDIVVNTNANL